MLSIPWPARNAIYGQIYQCWVTSVSVFTQQQPERRFSCAVRRGHGVEKDFGIVNRAHSASTIDFPPPRFWQRRSLLYNDGKIGVVDHAGNNVSHRYRKMLPCWATPPLVRQWCDGGQTCDIQAAFSMDVLCIDPAPLLTIPINSARRHRPPAIGGNAGRSRPEPHK
jgi:hypothetical protein